MKLLRDRHRSKFPLSAVYKTAVTLVIASRQMNFSWDIQLQQPLRVCKTKLRRSRIYMEKNFTSTSLQIPHQVSQFSHLTQSSFVFKITAFSFIGILFFFFFLKGLSFCFQTDSFHGKAVS